ncbi:hypothetical protein DL95DRAFT_520807 [Leptodontidium sp. 2 PMI_412]|nr:hypothetical protein DL95DRAFT_520807 [Leptodontidium sp. 2 PMI_412]
MVIVSLLTAGVGLALDAYAERQSVRDQRRNAGLQQQSSPLETGIIPADAKQRNREIEAFNELQNYADFQKALSEKVLNDLAMEDDSTSHGFPPQLKYNDGAQFSFDSLYGPRSQFGQGSLPNPVIIPQQRHQDGHCWPRTYSPSLMNCGIGHQAFLTFIDSFNESLKLSPRLDVVNVARLYSDIGWRNSSCDLTTAIPAAVRLAKSTYADASTNNLVSHANDVLFRVRGLFAMIVTSLPASPSQTLTVDSQTYRRNEDQGSSSRSGWNQNNVDASAEVPNFQGTPVSLPNRKLKQMSNFIADYSERRPHFRRISSSHSDSYEQSTNSSSKSSTLQQNLAHRKGPLSAFASSIANRNNHVGTQKRRGRRLGVSRPRAQESETLSFAANGEETLRANAEREAFPGIPMQAISDEAETAGDYGLGIQTGVLYLIVVNDIEAETKGKWNEQPQTSSTWNENGWESGLNMVRNTKISASPYDDTDTDMTSPPAYNSGPYFVGGMSNSGF